ncbi:uncharacterized protein [Ptychodera flava]|uniref:uncharacterized protein isoform X2 n=1 Tax=Ptychodera flava TaxID=63121 RepID=UPI00396A11CC
MANLRNMDRGVSSRQNRRIYRIVCTVLVFVIQTCYFYETEGIEYGHRSNTTGTILGNIQEATPPILQNISVTIQEDADVESVIYEDSFQRKGVEGFSFVEGNTDGVFGVNRDNGSIYLAKYLDYDDNNIYKLLVSAKLVIHGIRRECQVYNIEVIVIDVTGWPPYFNETCAWPVRKDYGYPLPFTVFSDYGDYRNIYTAPNPKHWNSFTVLDLNNGRCEANVYVSRNEHMYTKYGLDCNTNLFIRKANDPSYAVKKVIYQCRCYENPAEVPTSIAKTIVERGKNITPKFFAVTVPYEYLSLAIEDMFEISWNDLRATGRAKALGCPAGKYGGFCQYDCICQNGAICHTFNGACKCRKGWKGVSCDIPYKHLEMTPRTMSTYYDGPTSFICHAYNIQFDNYLWNQSHFSWYINSKLLDSLYYDIFVTEHIQETFSYSSIQVHSLTENYTGEYRCVVEDLSGVTYSDSGYAEINGCNRNKWGNKCELDCACVHSVKCDRYYGCACSLGWTGLHCEKACPDGMFGSNCSEECLCENENTVSCDSENGRCKCSEGVCGKLCEESCSCQPWQKVTCNGTSGCLCEEVSPGQHTNEQPYSERVIMIVSTLSVLTVLAIFGVAAVVICKKHKSKKYKRVDDEEKEICNVFKEILGKCENWLIKPNSLTKSNKLLGEGSFGQVYQGNFKPPGSKITEDVAIKSLLPARRNYQCNADFAREISCLIEVQGHPNIVILKGIVLQQGENCLLVMECATYGDLLNYLHRLGKRISKENEKELLCYTRHITLGMQYMQEKKILHRDLSARNILLFEGAVAKISDFGLSRDASNTKGVYVKMPWAENQTALPLKWMPPEFLTRGEFYYKSDVSLAGCH